MTPCTARRDGVAWARSRRFPGLRLHHYCDPDGLRALALVWSDAAWEDYDSAPLHLWTEVLPP